MREWRGDENIDPKEATEAMSATIIPMPKTLAIIGPAGSAAGARGLALAGSVLRPGWSVGTVNALGEWGQDLRRQDVAALLRPPLAVHQILDPIPGQLGTGYTIATSTSGRMIAHGRRLFANVRSAMDVATAMAFLWGDWEDWVLNNVEIPPSVAMAMGRLYDEAERGGNILAQLARTAR